VGVLWDEGTPYNDARGRYEGELAIATDNTERRQSEEAKRAI
jgi:hypothetical protein